MKTHIILLVALLGCLAGGRVSSASSGKAGSKSVDFSSPYIIELSAKNFTAAIKDGTW
jgi:hypothetical protein